MLVSAGNGSPFVFQQIQLNIVLSFYDSQRKARFCTVLIFLAAFPAYAEISPLITICPLLNDSNDHIASVSHSSYPRFIAGGSAQLERYNWVRGG